MVLPITSYGKFESIPHPKPGFTHLYSLYDWRLGTKQARPFDRPLAYSRDLSYLAAWNGASTSATEWLVSESASNSAKITAYDRLKDAYSSRASLGITLAEISQTWEMLHRRITQLATFTKRLNRFDFVGAASALNTGVPKGVSKRKWLADNYLEFHFGWAPVYADIFALCEVLQSPFDDVEIKASAKEVDSHYSDENGISRIYTATYIVKYGAKVRITNPNLWLLNQVGLLNPFGLLVEVTPFSFVLDWVINLNQFVGALTDWVGLELIDGYTTVYNRAIGDIYWDWDAYYQRAVSTGIVQHRIRRSLGISQPELGFRRAKPWHWRRLAAAASLLVQQTVVTSKGGPMGKGGKPRQPPPYTNWGNDPQP